MTHRAATVLLVAAGLVVLAGCGLFDDEKDRSAEARPTSTDQATTTTEPVPAATVTLLDAGAEPRQALRLQFTAGQRVTTTITFDLDVSQERGSVDVVDAPAVIQQATLSVDQVDPGGESAVVSVVIDDVRVSRLDSELDDEAADALDARLGEVEGLRGTGTLGADGRFRSFSYVVPDDADAAVTARARQMAEQVRALTVPLPTDPVGIGASWRTVTSTAASGFDVRQEATYEITAVDGTTISFAATLTQTGEDQDLADAEADTQAETQTETAGRLVSSRLTGRLTGSQDLASIGTSGRSELAGTQVVAVEAGGRTTEVDQVLRLTTIVESR